MKYSWSGAQVLVDGHIVRELAYPIQAGLQVDGFVLVLLDVPVGEVLNENVWAVDESGRVVWRIQPQRWVDADSPYVKLSRDGQEVVAVNWSGCSVVVDPTTGKILQIREGR